MNYSPAGLLSTLLSESTLPDCVKQAGIPRIHKSSTIQPCLPKAEIQQFNQVFQFHDSTHRPSSKAMDDGDHASTKVQRFNASTLLFHFLLFPFDF
jgi:hypothetical protein